MAWIDRLIDEGRNLDNYNNFRTYCPYIDKRRVFHSFQTHHGVNLVPTGFSVATAGVDFLLFTFVKAGVGPLAVTFKSKQSKFQFSLSDTAVNSQ